MSFLKSIKRNVVQREKVRRLLLLPQPRNAQTVISVQRKYCNIRMDLTCVLFYFINSYLSKQARRHKFYVQKNSDKIKRFLHEGYTMKITMIMKNSVSPSNFFKLFRRVSAPFAKQSSDFGI